MAYKKLRLPVAGARRDFEGLIYRLVQAVDLLRRHKRSLTNEDRIIDCVDMTGQEGDYQHVSTGSDAACGLYVITDVDKVVELEITHFNVGCEDNGLLAIVNGWELEGQLFPSPEEVDGGLEWQYRTFCGPSAPPAVFTASQNVALVHFRVPRAGQGFRVRVRFLRELRPCNVVAPFDASVLTIRNFGLRRNCTAEIIFPVNVLLLNADVRTLSLPMRRGLGSLSGLSVNCDGPSGADFVAFSYGWGLDTAYYQIRMAFCGRRSIPATRNVTLGCRNSAIRLQSSGSYVNSVTVRIQPPSAEELDSFVLRRLQCAVP